VASRCCSTRSSRGECCVCPRRQAHDAATAATQTATSANDRALGRPTVAPAISTAPTATRSARTELPPTTTALTPHETSAGRASRRSCVRGSPGHGCPTGSSHRRSPCNTHTRPLEVCWPYFRASSPGSLSPSGCRDCLLIVADCNGQSKPGF
jgi:hypothetical protein